MESASTADAELVSLRGYHSDEDQGLGKVQDQESIAPFEERPRKTGHSLSIHSKIMCCYVCPGGSREILEPVIKRVESSLRCLTLVCYMTPSLVEREVEGLGYAETAGASEEWRVVVAVPSQEGPGY
jgi:hypothetical protein